MPIAYSNCLGNAFIVYLIAVTMCRSATAAIVVKPDAQNAGSSPHYSCGPLAYAIVLDIHAD